MDIRTITPNVSVTGQITPADIAELKEMGFKAIIGNRPDGEESDQPAWTAIEQAARRAGMATEFIPIDPTRPINEEALAFRAAVTCFDKPVLAFCRTGMRSAKLWALAARDRLSSEEVIRMAATAGYDLGTIKDRLEQEG